MSNRYGELALAVAKGHIETVRSIVDSKADVNPQPSTAQSDAPTIYFDFTDADRLNNPEEETLAAMKSQHFSLPMVAAAFGHSEIMKILIEAQATRIMMVGRH